MTSWHRFTIAPSGSCHLIEGAPAYAKRFDEVLAFHSPGLAPVRLNGEAWHIHPDGSDAYSGRFRRTFGFYEGRAAVIADTGWHHIYPDGTAVYPERYAWVGNFQCARCAVRNVEGQYFHIDLDGKPAYAERWRYAGDFRGGIGVVQAEDGRSTHIDEAGQPMHGRWFLDLDVFHKGFARARDEAGWMHIDKTGCPVYGRRFTSIEPFYNGQARVERTDGGLDIINESGSTVAEIRPALRSDFAALSGDLVGFWRTQTIAAAVELGIFEALPGTSASISRACGLRPERARRLLRALVELSLITSDGQHWRLDGKGNYLRVDHPWSLSGAAVEYARNFSKMWGVLPDAIREKGGWRAPEVFGELVNDAPRREAHHQMLQSYARHDYNGAPEAMGLHGDERVVDAGGGLGVLASALATYYPSLHVVLLDRPEVIEQTKATGFFSDRIMGRGGDLFSPWRIEADAVVLARVLHDWNDRDALRILRHARATLSPGDKLFIVEMLLSDENVSGSLCDLHLLMVTGGQERTNDGYINLMEQAGFAYTEVRRLPALPSIIVGVAR